MRELNVDLYSSVVLETNSATFPLWNLSGQMVGYQRYTPDEECKYYTYRTKGQLACWGLEVLDTSKKYLLLVEGVFDACKLHNAGLNSLAVLTNHPLHLKSWLRTLPYTLVAVCEGDAAGKKLASLGDLVEYLPEGVDVGDMTQEEVNERFKKYKTVPVSRPN